MVSFKVLAVFAVLLLAVAGPALARVYVLDDGVPDDASNSTTETTTTEFTSTLPPETTTDDLPEPSTDPPAQDEMEDRIDPGEPPEIDKRSDHEQDYTWTPVALVNSGTTPFEVYKQADVTEQSPKRSGFRNVRNNRGGTYRHTNTVITQRPPPKPVSFTHPDQEVSYLPPAHETLPLEGEASYPSSSSIPPPLPPFTQQEPLGAFSEQVPQVVEPQDEDHDPSESSPSARAQQLQRGKEWREARLIEKPTTGQRPEKVISATGQVIQLIPFTLEDTVPRTTPTYFPHPAFNEQLNESEDSKKKQGEGGVANYQTSPTPPTFEGPRKETSFSTSRPTGTRNNPTQRNNPNRESKRNNGRPSFISKFNSDLSQDSAISVTRNPNEYQSDYATHPNGAYSRQVINFGNKTILEVAVGRKEENQQKNTPNFAQNNGNLPQKSGNRVQKPVNYQQNIAKLVEEDEDLLENVTSQERFNSSRTNRQFGGQSTSLGHRPMQGFDRYKVPGGALRPKVGYNIRSRHPSNSLHHHHHHPHDPHMSPSINVGRYALPPNTVMHGKPKVNGHGHRHPPHSNPAYSTSLSDSQHPNSQHPNSQHPNSQHPNSQHPSSQHSSYQHSHSQHVNSQYPNPQHPQHPGAPHPSNSPNAAPNPSALPSQGSSGNATGSGGQYAPQQPYPKPEYRPGSLPHPAPLSDLKRPHSAHDHLGGGSHKHQSRYPGGPYGKHRPPGLRPQVHPSDDHGHYQTYRKPIYGHEDSVGTRGQGPPGRHPRPGGPGGLRGPGGPGGPGGSGGHGGHGGPGSPAGLGGPSGLSGPSGHAPSGLSSPSAPGLHASGSHAPERYASLSQGLHKHKYGYNEPGKLPPPPQRHQYPGAGGEDAYPSAAYNNEKYAPSANKLPNPTFPTSSYDSSVATGYDVPPTDAQKPYAPQSQNPNIPSPTVHTYPFPTHPAPQSAKPKPQGHRGAEEGYDDYYPPHVHQIRPTTIRPTGYKNPNVNNNKNNGFSITEITQPSSESAGNPRRPGGDEPNKPKHYGFPRLSSTTARTPLKDEPIATSSQSVSVGTNAFNSNNNNNNFNNNNYNNNNNYQTSSSNDNSPGYAVYEDENYPTPQTTPRSRPKFTPGGAASHRGKSSYQAGGGGGGGDGGGRVASSTSRPRYKPRRPATLKASEPQAEGTSVTAAYGAPAAGGGAFAADPAGGSGEDVFSFAKTDYHGNVKWGVRHKVEMQGGGGGGDSYGH